MMLYDSIYHEQPKWWAVIVFFAPVTTPYFIFKSRREDGAMLIPIFLATFLLVIGLEAFIFSQYVKKTKYLHLSPVISGDIIFKPKNM